MENEYGLSQFLEYKLVESIVSNISILRVIEQNQGAKRVLLTNDFILTLNDFVDDCVSKNQLDKEQLNNLKELLSYIRLNPQLPKHAHIELLCNMLVAVNMAKPLDIAKANDIEFDYFVDKYVYRLYGYESILRYLNPVITPDIVKKIKSTIGKDYTFLSILVIASDDDFKTYLKDLVFNEDFLLSVTGIIQEYPNILKCDVFKKRLEIIINENINNYKNIEDKQKRKFISKKSKYCNTRLKEE